MNFLESLKKSKAAGEIDDKVLHIFSQFYESYKGSLNADLRAKTDTDFFFLTYLEKVIELLKNPFKFEPIHKAVRAPFDYYQFGLDFVRPLLDFERSHVAYKENIRKIDEQLAKNENAVLFANHQTETDPQLFSLILEKEHPHLAKEIIFVAGDRVLTDPLAVPFSLGRNLICIYSKRHIDNPPEKKEEKLLHNRRTMKLMKDLLAQGGKCIYVAPSGGRDRADEMGKVEPAPFDPNSIEIFRLMADESKKPTHFYPLALATYDILPPPRSIETELGEMRKAKRSGVLFAFGNEIDMKTFPGHEIQERQAKRIHLAMHIWNLVKADYQNITKKFNT